MNASISEYFPNQDKLKLTPTQIASRAVVDGAATAAGMAALVDLNNTGATPLSRVVRAVGAKLVAPAVLHGSAVAAGYDPAGIRKIQKYNRLMAYGGERELKLIGAELGDPLFGRAAKSRPYL
jgi:hypothetical protein